jgi:hypothetical protein
VRARAIIFWSALLLFDGLGCGLAAMIIHGWTR